GLCGMRWSRLLAVLSLTLRALAQEPCPVDVDSVVVDRSGHALAGVRFGDTWGQRDGVWSPGFRWPNHEQPVVLTSDRNGHVCGPWQSYGGPLLGLSADRTLAAFVEPQWDADHLPHADVIHNVDPAKATLADFRGRSLLLVLDDFRRGS